MDGQDRDAFAAETGIAHVVRDAAWRDEVDHQIVRFLAAREKDSPVPNLVGWLACLALAISFEHPEVFALPLILRLAAIGFTRAAANRLRDALKQGRPSDASLEQVGAAMCFAGISWGTLVWPLSLLQEQGGTTIALAAVIMTGVSLITSLLGAMPRMMLAFLGSFALMSLAGLAMAGRLGDPHFLAAMALVLLASALFSIGSARHHRRVAETMVDNRRLSEALADALGHAEFLSQRDPLTGLFNRRAFLECQRERERDDHLLAIDLDHFKRINDIYGHDIGDRVLVRVAEAIRAVIEELPGENRAVRMGGEEFAIELDVAETPAAEIVADAIRKRIALATLLQEPRGLSATASIGVSRRGRDEAFDSAYRRADQALLEAKRGGRDRVVAKAA